MNNLSDYIPILIAIGFGIFQIFRHFTKGSPTTTKSSKPPTDPFGGDSQDTGWDDLLEALGQKEKPKTSGPIPAPQPVPRVERVQPKVPAPIPPPVPRPVPEIPRRVFTERPKPKISDSGDNFEIYQPKIAEASELKFKAFDDENAEASTADKQILAVPLRSLRADRFRQFLGERERLREAVVLSEILNKPLALR